MASETKAELVAVTTPAPSDIFSTRQAGDTRDKGETRLQLHTLEVGQQFLSPIEGAGESKPSYGLGVVGTGLYSRLSGEITFATGSALRATMDSVGFRAGTGSAGIAFANPTATVPNVGPNMASDADTGLGRAAADQLSLIAGAVEGIRVSTTEVELFPSTPSGQLLLPDGVAAAPGIRFSVHGGVYGDNGGVSLANSLGQKLLNVASSRLRIGVDTFRPSLENRTSTSTIPTILPAGQTDDNTGIGHTTLADRMSLIAGGKEVARVVGDSDLGLGIGTPDVVPADASVPTSMAMFYLDETANELKVKVTYADGTTHKIGVVASLV